MIGSRLGIIGGYQAAVATSSPAAARSGQRKKKFGLEQAAKSMAPRKWLYMLGKAPKITSMAGLASMSKRNENRIIINVGGVRFETYKSTLKNIPDTRLAWLTESTSTNNADYDAETREYFFDRHPGVFAMILNYYRTGKLHTPMDVCGPMFEEELAFWGIDEKQMESCCWTTYRTHRDAQETLAELHGGNLEYESEEDDNIAKRFGIEEAEPTKITSWQRISPKIWAMLDDPHSGVPGKVITYVSVTFIFISILVMCAETIPLFRDSSNCNTTTNQSVSEHLRCTKPQIWITIMEFVTTAYFTLEVLLRILFSPNKRAFLKSLLNGIDILAVVTAYMIYVFDYLLPTISAILLIQCLKVPRIFRIFKLTKNFSGLKIVVHTMKASSKELLLLFIVFAIFVVLCGTMAYIAEQMMPNPTNDLTNMPLGFWWALVTMTTVGYGDVVPKTLPGYLIGVICTIIGVLVIALPVPIIVNNFALYYTHAQAQLKLPKRHKRALVGAPDALKQPMIEVESEEDAETGSTDNRKNGKKMSDSFQQRKGSEESIVTSIDSGIKAGSGSNNSNEISTGITVIYTDEIETENARPKLKHERSNETDEITKDKEPSSPRRSLQNGVVKEGRISRRASLRPNGHVIQQIEDEQPVVALRRARSKRVNRRRAIVTIPEYAPLTMDFV